MKEYLEKLRKQRFNAGEGLPDRSLVKGKYGGRYKQLGHLFDFEGETLYESLLRLGSVPEEFVIVVPDMNNFSYIHGRNVRYAPLKDFNVETFRKLNKYFRQEKYKEMWD